MLFKKYEPKHAKKNTGRKPSAAARIAYLLIAVVLTSSVTFSSYSTSTTGSDSARVARYVFKVTDKDSKDEFSQVLSELRAPGESVDVVFTVTNKDGELCEVTQEYDIHYSHKKNLPLQFELKNTDTNGTGQPFGATKGILPAGAEATHTYTLTVTWDPNMKDPKLANEIDKVTIQVSAEQIAQ